MFRELDAFDVVHEGRPWPWLSFSPCGTKFAHGSSPTQVATRTRDGARPGVTFEVPAEATAFALSASDLLAVASGGAVWLLGAAQPVRLLPEGDVRALSFDRAGLLFVASETAEETVVSVYEGASLVGATRSPAFPRPALHELHLHPQDDAMLLLAACGEAGSYARVVGHAGREVSRIPTALDEGGVAAGFVGFSADGARVHLAEADELRTHAWPTLHELSSVPFADEFVSSFAGAVLGTDVLVDGEDTDTGDDAVMAFDRTAIRGTLHRALVPPGMWAGRLGADAIVTVTSKGTPVRGRVLVRTTASPSLLQ